MHISLLFLIPLLALPDLIEFLEFVLVVGRKCSETVSFDPERVPFPIWISGCLTFDARVSFGYVVQTLTDVIIKIDGEGGLFVICRLVVALRDFLITLSWF